MDSKKLRREYVFEGVGEIDLDPDPFKLFTQWFDAAVAAKIELADVITLATASPRGVPSARMVVLRGADEEGFVFYTDYRSAKSRDLEENPRAALVIYWKEMGRQIRITGKVNRVSFEYSAAYFRERPLESQIAAMASHQSAVIADRQVLEDRYEQLSREVDPENMSLPSYWGGYRVVPEEFEFWQGRERRLHDRFRYRPQGDGWLIERLSP